MLVRMWAERYINPLVELLLKILWSLLRDLKWINHVHNQPIPGNLPKKMKYAYGRVTCILVFKAVELTIAMYGVNPQIHLLMTELENEETVIYNEIFSCHEKMKFCLQYAMNATSDQQK